ncbi:MAG: GNAT family N-acetyltransferase [Sphaerochaeta sp.]
MYIIEATDQLDEHQLYQFWRKLGCPEIPDLLAIKGILTPSPNEALIRFEVKHDLETVGMVIAVSDAQNRIAYIQFLGVLPEYRNKGSAKTLLLGLEKHQYKKGIQLIKFRGNPNNYIYPGIDVHLEKDLISLLKRCDYKESSFPIAMRLDLTGLREGLQIPQFISQYTVREIEQIDLDQITVLCEKLDRTEWILTIQSGYKQRKTDSVGYLCVDQDSNVVGFGFFGIIGSDLCRFGPIGVDPGHRGHSIGKRLVLTCLEAQRKLGCLQSYFLWGDKGSVAEKMYTAIGFKVFKEMVILEKSSFDILLD